jgi:hypothetical protein
VNFFQPSDDEILALMAWLLGLAMLLYAASAALQLLALFGVLS